MPQSIREVMTGGPMTIQASDPLVDAARMMREKDIGDVIVMKDGDMCGILTDRDITVRAVAEGKDPAKTTAGEVCTANPLFISADDDVSEAIDLMREKAVRRLPVIDAGKPVGVVSLGDLAEARDPESVLADISAAPPNN